jgi:hypothetical protein
LVLLWTCAPSVVAQVIIDDDFNDGGIETGGTNGGFVYVGNPQATDVALLEEDSIATVEMIPIASWGNKGMTSISSFDATSLPEFTATFVVDNVSPRPAGNGQFLGITDDGETFYRLTKNFGFVFFGMQSRTNSSRGFSLAINDSYARSGAEHVLASEVADLDSYLDGFTASFTVRPSGWSYEVTGLAVLDFVPTTFADEGTWLDSGLDANFYADFFDEAEHVTVSAHTNNLELIHSYDRITLQSGSGDQPRLQAGDADQDLDFDQFDLVRVQQAAKYMTGQPATWGEGDWDGAPGGMPGSPPPGNGRFDQFDIVAALRPAHYLQGQYAALSPGGATAHTHATAIPEPMSALLLAIGLAIGLANFRRVDR